MQCIDKEKWRDRGLHGLEDKKYRGVNTLDGNVTLGRGSPKCDLH